MTTRVRRLLPSQAAESFHNRRPDNAIRKSEMVRLMAALPYQAYAIPFISFRADIKKPGQAGFLLFAIAIISPDASPGTG